MASLKSTLSLLAEHENVLIALLEAADGLTMSELSARVASPRGNETGLSPNTLQRMLDLGLLEERPGESVYLELSLPLRGFLGQLLRTHELVTPEAIRGYVTEIEGQGRALATAAVEQDSQAAVLALERVAAAIERVRSYAGANHGAILERVLRAKAGADGYAAAQALWFRGTARPRTAPARSGDAFC